MEGAYNIFKRGLSKEPGSINVRLRGLGFIQSGLENHWIKLAGEEHN